MARIRSIHPGLFTDEAFVSCNPLARLLLLGIWTESDDFGVFEWKPVTLKMKLLAADQADVPDLLNDLVAFDIIKQVTLVGKQYGLVRNFCRYQRPKLPSERVPLPKELWTYVGLNADGSRPDNRTAPSISKSVMNQSGTTAPTTPANSKPVRNRSRTGPVKPSQMEEGGDNRRKKEEGDSSNHIDKPVVVVAPRDPETLAGTTTTQVENDLVVQGEAPERPSNPLGTALPEDWIPDEACLTVAFEHGMGEVDVESEVLRFHALNAQRGTFSQNWAKTWTLWCAEFKRRADKAAAKAPPRVEVSAGFKPTPEQWDGCAKLYAQTGRWSSQFGPDPESPACRCPPEILEKHLPNPAAIPVLRARAAKVPA